MWIAVPIRIVYDNSFDDLFAGALSLFCLHPHCLQPCPHDFPAHHKTPELVGSGNQRLYFPSPLISAPIRHCLYTQQSIQRYSGKSHLHLAEADLVYSLTFSYRKSEDHELYIAREEVTITTAVNYEKIMGHTQRGIINARFCN